MDPQQRLLLEVVYEALENAGITLQEINGTQTSVFCRAVTGSDSASRLCTASFTVRRRVTSPTFNWQRSWAS